MDQNLSPEKEAQAAVEQILPDKKKPGRKALQIFAIVVLLALVGGGIYAWQNNRVAQLNKEVALKKTTVVTTKTTDPYAGWKSYTSTIEKSTFKYPADWKLVSKIVPKGSYLAGADEATLTSPSGKLVINWISAIDGIGGACDPESCPYVTTLSSQPLASVPNLFLTQGTYSPDNKLFIPWMGLKSEKTEPEVLRWLLYVLFTGKNNGSLNPTNESNLSATFSTNGSGAPKSTLTKAQAEAYFNSPEGKQAKLIFESYSY